VREYLTVCMRAVRACVRTYTCACVCYVCGYSGVAILRLHI